MATYRLGSSSAVHTPGIIAWAINGYSFVQDQPRLLDVISSTFPTVPREAIHELLSKEVPYKIDGETVVFSVEG
ncbi:hypothetical protein DL1_20375 [Thioclava dalianensis]|uniref:Uncharacterized protein n=1 Tax=Thioclava dalianensis TaxID=1185766 RepID=A0A074T7P7_9RHOB|nr:hypothetical protein [Thioclava dalianensis]KEP67796.1 hypothetical protein DL1_20375 [Thioclava dalianensis]SFN95579.1 hypothetical protein SAMN05216224_1381 [Thioclava dalianensis]